jgi:acyl-CoA synthetase (AMP-forming)/AMP-acid ligase II
VLVPWLSDDPPLAPGVRRWDDALAPHAAAALAFERLPFDHPLYVLYSSGTTGRPSASCTARAARCSSTRRSSSCTWTCARASACSTSPRVAG